MRQPEYSTQFRRDVKRAQKRGKNVSKLKELLALLVEGDELPPRYRDHPLKNDWAGYRDAHLEPAWLLVNSLGEDRVRFERSGTHSDLFE